MDRNVVGVFVHCLEEACDALFEGRIEFGNVVQAISAFFDDGFAVGQVFQNFQNGWSYLLPLRVGIALEVHGQQIVQLLTKDLQMSLHSFGIPRLLDQFFQSDNRSRHVIAPFVRLVAPDAYGTHGAFLVPEHCDGPTDHEKKKSSSKHKLLARVRCVSPIQFLKRNKEKK